MLKKCSITLILLSVALLVVLPVASLAVAMQQKDGTLLAYQLLAKDDGVWGKPTLIER